MSIEVTKHEQYTVIQALTVEFDDISAAAAEKSIALQYASEGRINYILDLKKCTSISEAGIKLLQKVQKICANESGLWVVVSDNDQILDEISTKSEEFILMLPTLDEAIDAVYMNELENDFKDEHDDEFGLSEESDY